MKTTAALLAAAAGMAAAVKIPNMEPMDYAGTLEAAEYAIQNIRTGAWKRLQNAARRNERVGHLRALQDEDPLALPDECVADPAAGCCPAITTLVTEWTSGTCLVDHAAVFGALFSDDAPPPSTSDLDSFCSSTCFTSGASAVNAAKRDPDATGPMCQELREGGADDLTMLCTRAGGEYCVQTLYSSAAFFEDDTFGRMLQSDAQVDPAAMTAQLDAMCGPCGRTLIDSAKRSEAGNLQSYVCEDEADVFTPSSSGSPGLHYSSNNPHFKRYTQVMGDALAAQFESLCTQDANGYCMLNPAFLELTVSTPNPLAPDALDTTCSPCGRGSLQMFSATMATYAHMSTALAAADQWEADNTSTRECNGGRVLGRRQLEERQREPMVNHARLLQSDDSGVPDIDEITNIIEVMLGAGCLRQDVAPQARCGAYLSDTSGNDDGFGEGPINYVASSECGASSGIDLEAVLVKAIAAKGVELDSSALATLRLAVAGAGYNWDTACPATCSNYLQGLVDTYGCCTSITADVNNVIGLYDEYAAVASENYTQFISDGWVGIEAAAPLLGLDHLIDPMRVWVDEMLLMDEGDILEEALRLACGVDLSGTCGAPVRRSFVTEVSNVRHAWYDNQDATTQQAFQTAFRNDVASQAGVLPNQVIINAVEAGAGGIEVDYTIDVPDAEIADAAERAMDRSVESGAMGLDHTFHFFASEALGVSVESEDFPYDLAAIEASGASQTTITNEDGSTTVGYSIGVSNAQEAATEVDEDDDGNNNTAVIAGAAAGFVGALALAFMYSKCKGGSKAAAPAAQPATQSTVPGNLQQVAGSNPMAPSAPTTAPMYPMQSN